MPFSTLTDQEEKELWQVSRSYWQEALRWSRVKAYLAGCVTLGSALETLLILMINCFSDEVERTGQIPLKKGRARVMAHARRRSRIETIIVSSASCGHPREWHAKNPYRCL
jgi:hypothetical protein